MLVSLCPALATTASADAQVTTVTLNSGDTVVKLCQNIGVDYYAHRNLIMSLNGFTSEAQFSKMAVGSKVVLPVSNAAAASLSSSGVGAATTTTTTPVASTVVGTTGAITGTSTSIPTGDYASYYLVSYTIQPGETISGIYNNWGLSYKTYSNQILKLNRLANFNSIPAGKTLILPTTNPAIAGSSYTTVMAHVMRAGDSAYNIICTNYGLNYNSVQTQVQALNNRENLGNFMVGEVLYIPVNGLVSSNTTVTPGTGSSSSSAIINGSVAYNLVSQTPVNGNFALIVDGNAATAAIAGKTVEIVATPNTGYAVSQISVTKVGDANTAVAVQGNKFVMPAYSVSVSVSFSQAIVSEIKVDAATNGAVSAMVNSAVVSSATAGNVVTVKTIPATGFMLDTIRVTYNDYRDTVAVENGKFVMPTFPVTVSASFKVDPNYDPSVGHNIYVDAANAKVVTKIGDTEVKTAKAGDRVTLNITPDANYTVQNLAVYYDNFNKTVDVEKNAFTMPDGPVTIVATVKPTASAVFGITKVVTNEGKLSVTVNGQEASSANVGAKVQITATSNKAYFNYIPTVFKTGDTGTTVPVAADGTFTMPDFPVSVSVKFYIYRNIYLDASNGTNGWFNVTAAANGMAVSKAGAGVQLKVTVWGYNQSTHAPGNVIVTYADGSVHNLDGATFIMPDCDIKVRVNFNPVQYITAYSAKTYNANGSGQHRGYNSYTVNGTSLDDNGNYTKTIAAGRGNNVIVNPGPALGYTLDRIEYRYYDTAGKVQTGKVNYDAAAGRYQFQMPTLKSGTSFEVFCYFKQIKNYSITLKYDAGLGSVTALSSIGVVTSSVPNAKITLKYAPKSGYVVDFANITVKTASGNDVAINRNDYTFFMPSENVVVTVPFKSELNKIKVSPIPYSDDNTTHKGMLSVLVNGAKYTEAQLTHERALPDLVKAGALITVINESSHGYILNAETPITVVTSTSSVPVEMIQRDKFSFVMPNADVTITANYDDDMYNIVAVTSENGSFTVPKQGNHTKALDITDIVPKPGYEVDEILVTYTDFTGIEHKKEPISANGFIPAGNGIPKSDVVIEVTFKASLNPISINYIYNSTPNTTLNYAVDLYMDGQLVEGIQRNAAENTDLLPIDEAKDQGLLTGSTVVIKRQEHNQDSNFQIKNLWIMHNGKAIQPEYSNNQYHFTVPYVDSKLPADLVLNVEYGTENDQGFRLEAVNADANDTASTAAIYVNGAPATMAQPYDNIRIEFNTPANTEVSKVVFSYKNSDGVEVFSNEYPVNGNIFEIAKGAVDHPITTLPKSNIAYATYTVSAAAHSVSYDASNGGSAQFFVDGSAVATGAEVSVGKNVTVQIDAVGMAATSVEAKCGEAPVSVTATADGKFQFTMPDGDVVVKANFVSTSYVLKSVNSSDGTGTVKYMVGETEYADGSSIPAGSNVSIIAIPDAGSYVSGVDSNVTTTEGKYSIVMPGADTTIAINFTKVSNGVSYDTAQCKVTVDGANVKNNTPVTYGSTVVVTPIVAEGKQVSAVTVKCGETDVPVTVNADGTCSFSMPQGVANITVSYTNAAFAIAVEKSGNGTVGFMVNGAPNDGSSIPHGTEVTVVATPDAGNSLTELLVNGVARASGYAFTMPANNVAVKATFAPASYTVKLGSFAEGSAQPVFSINGDAVATIALDSPIKISVTGDYILESVVAKYKGLDGNDVSDDMTVTKSDSEDGVYLLKLNNVPQNGAEILLTVDFSKIKGTHTINVISAESEENAEIKFFDSSDVNTRKSIDKALEGSTVYGELTVKKYNMTVQNNNITWDGGNESAPVVFHRVADENTAVYKFEFTMPAEDIDVNFGLVYATKIYIGYNDGLISVSGSDQVNGIIEATLLDTTNYSKVFAKFVALDGSTQDIALNNIGGTFQISFSAIPLHSTANNARNLVSLYPVA